MLFREAHSYDRLLLEYDSVRAGGFEALRFVPDDTSRFSAWCPPRPPSSRNPLLCGARSTRRPHLPLDLLAVSPRCGFASDCQGTHVTVDVERRKLELVLRTAEDVWGGVGSPSP